MVRKGRFGGVLKLLQSFAKSVLPLRSIQLFKLLVGREPLALSTLIIGEYRHVTLDSLFCKALNSQECLAAILLRKRDIFILVINILLLSSSAVPLITLSYCLRHTSCEKAPLESFVQLLQLCFEATIAYGS